MARMSNVELKDKELQAHIYQQLFDLQPYLVPNTQVAIVITQGPVEPKADSAANIPTGSLVKLVASTSKGRLESEALDIDVYEAVSKAKVGLKMQIESIFNFVDDSQERDIQVDLLSRGNFTIH